MSSDFMLWKDLREGALLSADAISAYNKILQLGLLELEADLRRAKPYGHTRRRGKYGDKNLYFNRANALGISLLRQNATGFSKMYYWNMLNKISNFEKAENKPLNKGMVCANLGVSSLAEGDIDGGIAYLAWATREDRAWIKGNPENSTFEGPLYVQFAKGTNRGGTSQFGKPAPWIMLKNVLERYNALYKEKVDLTLIFKEIEDAPEHRALFEGAIWTIHRNLAILRKENERGIYKKENNVFTRLRLFDGIINLCRFIEIRMRHNELNLKLLKKKHLKELKKGVTLGGLLWRIFGKGWYKPAISKIPRFTSPKDFNKFVKSQLKSKSTHVRSRLLLLVIRNYSVHLSDPNTPFLFEKIERILDEIIASHIQYLKYRKLI